MFPSSQSASSNTYEDRSLNQNSNSSSTFSSQHRPSLHHSRSLPLGNRLSSTPSPSYAGSTTTNSDWTGQGESGMLWRDEGISPGAWTGEGEAYYEGGEMGSSFFGGFDDQHQQLAPPPPLPPASSAQGSRTDILSGRSSHAPLSQSSSFDDSPYISWGDTLSRSSTPSSDTFPSSPSHSQLQDFTPPRSQPQQQLRHPLFQSNLHYSNAPASIAAARRTSQPELRNASNSSSSSNLLPHLHRQAVADVVRRGSLPSGRFTGGLVAPDSYQKSGGGGGNSGVHTLRQELTTDATLRRGSLPDGLDSPHITLPPNAVHPSFTNHPHPYQLQSYFNADTFDAQPAQSRSFGNRRLPLLRSVSDSSSTSNHAPLRLSSSSPSSQYATDRNLPSSLSALSVQSPTSMGYARGSGGRGLQLHQPPSNEVSPSRPCFPVAEEEEAAPMQTEGFDGDWEKASHPLLHQNSSEEMARGRSDASSVSSRQSHWPAPITTTELRYRAFSTASSSSSSGISTPNYHLSPGVTPNSTLHTVPSVLYSFSPSNEGGVPSPHYLEYQHQQQQQQQSSIINNFTPPPQDSSTFRTRAKRSASAPGPSLLSIRETTSLSSSNNDPMITDTPKANSSAVRHIKPALVLGHPQPLVEDQEVDKEDGPSSESEEDDNEADEDFVEKESRSTDADEEMTDDREQSQEETTSGKDESGEDEMDQDPAPLATKPGRNRTRRVLPPMPTGTRFPEKLYKMANAASSRPHVDWSPSGGSMIIPDPEEFASAVLPLYFKHDKLSSFLRQLNIYGFHRLRNPSKLEDGKETKKSLEFSHPNFLRGREDLVPLVVRNSVPLARSTRKSIVTAPPSSLLIPSPPPPPAVVEGPSPAMVPEERQPEPEPNLEPEPEPEVVHPPPPPRPLTPPLPEPLTYEQLQNALRRANSAVSSLVGHLRETDRRRVELEQVAARLKLFVLRRLPREQLSEIADLLVQRPYSHSSSPNHYHPPTSAPHSQRSFNLSIPSHQPLTSAPTPSPTLSSHSGGNCRTHSSSSSSTLSLLGPPTSANPSEPSPSSGFFAAQDHLSHQHDGSFSPTKRPRLSPGGTGLVYATAGAPLLSPSEKTPTSAQHASSSSVSRPLLPRKTSSKTLRVGNVGGSSLAARRRTASSSNANQQHAGTGLGLIDQPILNFGLEQHHPPSHGVKVEVEEMDDDLMGRALKGVYHEEEEGPAGGRGW